MATSRPREKWVIAFDHFEQRRAEAIASSAERRNLLVKLVRISEETVRWQAELADAVGLVLCFHSPEQYVNLFTSIRSFTGIRLLIIASYSARYEHLKDIFASTGTEVYRAPILRSGRGIEKDEYSIDEVLRIMESPSSSEL
jgi:hypothetical protein